MNNPNTPLPPASEHTEATAHGANPQPVETKRRRLTGLHIVAGLLAVTVMIQTAFIGFLFWGVSSTIGTSLDDVSKSPLMQELSKLDLNNLGSLEGLDALDGLLLPPPATGNTPSPAPQKPDTFRLPPGWDGGVLPDDPHVTPDAPGAPATPFLDPNVEVTLDDLMGIFQHLDKALEDELRRLEDPAYGGNDSGTGISDPDGREVSEIAVLSY